jgi:Arc/MetJ-type ribon-helix-helix transcriptional regulator
MLRRSGIPASGAGLALSRTQNSAGSSYAPKTSRRASEIRLTVAHAIDRGMTYTHTMGRAKIAITIDREALAEIDRLVKQGVFPNRSQAFEAAVKDRLERLRRSRLAREAAKLSKIEEQALADEGYVGENEWPEY